MNEQKNQYPVKEGDIVFCIKESEDLVLYALYKVKGAEEIDGDIILSLETGDGGKRYASLSYFQGFCPAEGWNDSVSLNEVMEQEGYADMMEGVVKYMEVVEKLQSRIDLMVGDEAAYERAKLAECESHQTCGDDCPYLDECIGSVTSEDEYEPYEDEYDDDWQYDDNDYYDDVFDDESYGEMSVREEVLNEAKKCVCGNREEDYGSPENNFKRIADLWAAYKGCSFTPVDVAAMMGLVKIARVASGNFKRDNWVDLAGYAACGGEMEHNAASAVNL